MTIRIITPEEAEPLFERKAARMADAEEVVKPILNAVRERGDAALADYAKRLDGFIRPSFVVPKEELAEASRDAGEDLKLALAHSAANIAEMCRLQLPNPFWTELAPGQFVGQIIRPLETIAAYIPGGRYPLPSTVLMTCIPAQVAGVANIWMTTPRPNRETFAAAVSIGVSNVCLLGGAQAIAGFAFGTETLPKADRIVGPGNIYVSAAKKLLAGEVGIDFVAGPTELLIIANEGNPAWIAADMLAQAEHDTDAASILLTTSSLLAEAVAEEIEKQLENLPTAETARKALSAGSAIIVTTSDDQSIEFSNRLAPEHLWVADREFLPNIQHAGSIFIGPYSPEATGDYSTGPNHVLPTSGAARLHGGLSVLDFLKITTVQQLDLAAIKRIAPWATTLARAEGLEAHARSIEIRLPRDRDA